MYKEIILQLWNNSELKFSTRNCAILWGNGSWKSSLTRKILQFNNSDNKIQIISAQRNMIFKQWSLRWEQDDELNNKLFSFSWGLSVDYRADTRYAGIFYREDMYNNIIQNDFNENIEKLYRGHLNLHAFSSMNYQGWDYSKPITNADKVFQVWNHIFLDKELSFDIDWKIKVKSKIDTNIVYEIENLSDGERSALYLITKCVFAPENWIIIVDEWETHLNSALLNDLWDQIESSRMDCRFIYISHDINFITTRIDCKNFWIKWFTHPSTWVLEEINNEELPEELILQIIGSKKQKILFVESDESHDKVFYQKIYDDFKIISIKSCQDVINFTSVLNSASQDYHKQYFWLIDRDLRTEEEVNALQLNKIYTLPVWEFENIFFKKEVVKFIFKYLWRTDFEEKFSNLQEAIFSLKWDLKFKENYYKNYIHQKFNQNLASFQIGENFEFKYYYSEADKLWDLIQKENDYDKFLQVLNTKWVKWTISELWYSWNDYYSQILNLFNTEKKDDLKKVFLSFMPHIG